MNKQNKSRRRLIKPLIQMALALSVVVACASKQDSKEEVGQAPPPTERPQNISQTSQPLAKPIPVNPGVTSGVARLQSNSAKADSRLKRERTASTGYVQDLDDDKNGVGSQVKHNTEDYDRIVDNPFLAVMKNPLSTFSIDVDTAAYSNTRRFIEQQHQLPPADAVRIEEFVNYFPYDYPNPSGKVPFSITTNLADCPWQPEHKLLRIGLKGKPVSFAQSPPSNLVFLLDVSGSMSADNKLPLLKRSLKLVVDRLREEDTVSIVVYAGAAGVVLPPTSGAKKEIILEALDRLQAGGSTAGSAGIKLAYEMAQKNMRKNSNSRVILATDGDFNVGPSSDGELTRLIEEKRKAGIFLSVLGYGMGNYKDNKMEKLADKGNGNYAYIDNLMEARKVLVTQMGGTLLTLAKDVKLQLEFNPSKVASYRLIGYENRLLAAEDFDDDTKDAGELGAGTTVTALYELTPATGEAAGHDLKYQNTSVKPGAKHSNEWLNVKLRYKAPDSDTSQLLSEAVTGTPMAWQKVPADFRFAAAVAGFGMQLRDSEHKGKWAFEDVIAQARQGVGVDKEGYRQSFVSLAEQAKLLKQTD